MTIRISMIHTVFTLAAVAIVPLACDEGGGGDSPDAEFRAGGYTDEELFIGIVLGQGEVAERLPTMWGGDSSARRDAMADMAQERSIALLDEAIRHAREQRAEGVARGLEAQREDILSGRVGEELQGPNDFRPLLLAIEEVRPGFIASFGEDVQSGDHIRVKSALDGARAAVELVWEEMERPSLGGDQEGLAILIDTVAVYDKVLAYDKLWWKTGTPVDSVIQEEIVVDEVVNGFVNY